MSYTGDYVLSVRTPSDDLLLPLRWLQRKEAEEGGEGKKGKGDVRKEKGLFGYALKGEPQNNHVRP